MKIIKWGILGTGSIAKAFADALKETDGELVAVASSTEQRAKEFCATYGCKPIGGHHNLISMPEIVLAVTLFSVFDKLSILKFFRA